MPSSHRIGRRTSAVGDDSIASESEILRSLFELRKCCNRPSSQPTVTEITFWNCQWTRRIINSLRKLIIRDGHRFSSFKFFDCEVISSNFAEIISIVLSCNTTTKLIIKARKLIGSRNGSNGQQINHCESPSADSPFEKNVLVAIREGVLANTSLKYLQISGLNFKNTTTPTSGDVIIGNRDNVGKTVDTIFWDKILSKNNTLTHLDLSGSNLSKSTISGLSSALTFNKTLEFLNFGYCQLDDHSLADILQSVKNHPALIELNLSRNFLANGASTVAVHAVAELLRSNASKLQCLDLSYQQHQRPISPDADHSADEISVEERHREAFKDSFDALSINTTLRRIDLSGNSGCFSDIGCVKALTACLVANNRLSHVDISACNLTPIAFEHLAQNCVPRCGRQLKSLVLFDEESSSSNSSLVTESETWSTIFSLLEKALQLNSSIESLGDFGDAAINSQLKSNLQYLLNLNRAGRRAFRIDDLPLGVWPRILARASCVEYDYQETGIRSIDASKPNKESLSSLIPASVLFEFLHGPAVLIDSMPRK